LELSDGKRTAVLALLKQHTEHQSQHPMRHSWGTVILGDTCGSNGEISGAWVGFDT